jgi:hypothetical protein
MADRRTAVVPMNADTRTYVAGLIDPALFLEDDDDEPWPDWVVPTVPLPGGVVWFSVNFPKYAAFTVTGPFLGSY